MTGNKALAGQNNGGREAQKRLAGIRKELAALAEPDYAAFAAKLLRKPQEAVPGGSAARLLGVRLPALRKMAARLAKEDWAGNLEALEGAGDGAAFEEIMLRGFLIGQAKIAPGKAFALIRGFLPCVDNWSLCDSFCAGLKFAEKNREALWDFLQPCFASAQEYEVRFAVVTALDYFVTEEYLERVLGQLEAVRHEAYYVSMAVAWAVSVCYVRFPVRTQEWMETCRLDEDTFRRAVQKIRESRRVSPEDKERLKGLWMRCPQRG